jgi:hypothetical protein
MTVPVAECQSKNTLNSFRQNGLRIVPGVSGVRRSGQYGAVLMTFVVSMMTHFGLSSLRRAPKHVACRFGPAASMQR